MQLKAVYLDDGTLDQNDLDFSPLEHVFTQFQRYASTSPEQTVARLQHADVVLTNKAVLTAEMIQQLPQLKLILVTATGTNNVDLVAATARNIPVCNCQGYGTTSVAQHTIALMLALATNVVQYNNAVKQGKWQQTEQFCFLDFPIVELAGKTLGILGYGALGQEVARLAQALGMNVIVGNLPNRPPHAGRLALDELLPQVDVLSLHCPLTEDTRHLIDEKQFKLMKPSAFLINAARGGIVNEHALAYALQHGLIAGAATDVLSIEPPQQGNVLLDPSIPNLIITPHSAWGSTQARQSIVNQVAENVNSFIGGHPLRQVNASH
ncbi:MAG: 2-hydroxyacid dehydrogenase [Acinetobacter sp.]